MSIRAKLLYVFYHYIGAPFRMFPINKNTILLEAYYGKGFQDSPSVIAEELHKRDSNLKLVWLVRNEEEARSLPTYLTMVKRFSFKELYYLACSKVWIDNCRKNKGVVKRKGQYYIQTWHGGLHGKRVEKDVIKTLSPEYVENAIHDSEMADLFISGSRWETDLYHNSFWYDGKVLEEGLPRNDIFFKQPNAIIKKVFNHFRLDNGVKIALYAPTFRQSGTSSCYDLDFNRMLKNIEKAWGGKWVLLVRMHPSATFLQNSFVYTGTILNASEYSEINELIVASSFFVTDYSSCMFDAMLTKTRIIRYASDVAEYNEERGAYFSESELPLPLATNNEEMMQVISMYNYEKEIEKRDRFLSKYGSAENGTATKSVAEIIMQVLKRV